MMFALLLVISAGAMPMPRPNTTVVFTHGEGGYPCIRIPAIVNARGVLIAFAECRRQTGDGCEPLAVQSAVGAGGNATHDICFKRSMDGGATWSALRVAVPDAAQPTAVYDSLRSTLILNGNAHGGPTRLMNPNLQALSTDDGATWSPPTEIDLKWPAQSRGTAAGVSLACRRLGALGVLTFSRYARRMVHRI